MGTWLLVRYDPSDMGARPIPGGDVFWESLDIRLTGGDEYGNPVGGQPATVHTRIWNLGDIPASPVRVDFSYIAPSLGILPSAPAPIGTGWGAVPPLRASVITCSKQWVPPVGPADIHACLIVTCSAPLQNDLPTVPGNAVADRHSGQHNMTIQEGSAGQEFHFSVAFANLGPEQAAVALVAAGTWRTSAELGRSDVLLAPSLTAVIGAVATPRGGSDYVLWGRRAALLNERAADLQLDPLPAAGLLEAVRVNRVRRHGVIDSNPVVGPPNRLATAVDFTPLGHSVDLRPQESALADITVTLPAEPTHPWFVVHLGQTSGDVLSGGYTMAFRMK
jgi:hypothetical protein